MNGSTNPQRVGSGVRNRYLRGVAGVVWTPQPRVLQGVPATSLAGRHGLYLTAHDDTRFARAVSPCHGTLLAYTVSPPSGRVVVTPSRTSKATRGHLGVRDVPRVTIPLRTLAGALAVSLLMWGVLLAAVVSGLRAAGF